LNSFRPKNILNLFSSSMLLLVLVVFFQNCGVQKPMVELSSSMSVGVSHTPTPESCSSCHLGDRPATFKTKSLNMQSNAFIHESKYNGTADCVLCHAENAQEVGKTWKNGIFNHVTPASSFVTNCTECHTGEIPQGLVGTANFNHATIGTQDCFSCHKNAGADWAVSNFSHAPVPSSCTSCHLSARPPATQFIAKNPASPTVNLYAHATQYNGGADCVNCHTAVPANVGVRWSGGIYNHKTNTGATVATCLDCHLGSRPTMPVGLSNFNHATSGQGDCFACHKNAGGDWKTDAFSHTPTPTSCNSCHNSARPASSLYFAKDPTKPTINLYAHTTAYNGGADCVSCHTSVPANIGVRWTGGVYNHKTNTGATITTCQDCHYGSRPTNLVGTSQFNHTTNGSGDCFQCHKNAGIDWQGTAVPVTVDYLSPSTVNWGTITTAHPSTTSQAGMTCTTCHVNYNPTLSIKGFDHGAMPSGTKCVSCHLTGQVVVNSTGITGFKTKASNHEGGVSYTKDCVACHNPTPTNNDLKAFRYPTWNTTTKKFTGGMWK
jgi:hypothetical protein